MQIMVVDDSRVMRQLVRRTLRQAGLAATKVQEAENGEDALQKLKDFRPDIILSDWNMPVMGGLDLLKTMRAQEDQTPFAFVTSESTADMRAQALQNGALFLLTKPFGPDTVRSYLKESGFTVGAGRSSGMDAHKASATFDARALSNVITHLVDTRVDVKDGPKYVRAGRPTVAARWVDDDDNLVYAGFCELVLAASFGGRFGLRPGPAVAKMVKTGRIEPGLHADIREVFNVVSRAFNDAGSIHVRLEEIYVPPVKIPDDVLDLEAACADRMDFLVNVPKYGNGRLGIVSMSKDFIAYP